MIWEGGLSDRSEWVARARPTDLPHQGGGLEGQLTVSAGVPRATLTVARLLIAPPGVETRSMTM